MTSPLPEVVDGKKRPETSIFFEKKARVSCRFSLKPTHSQMQNPCSGPGGIPDSEMDDGIGHDH